MNSCYTCHPLELGKAVLAIISMRLEFYKVPDQESGEKKTEKKGKGKGKKLTNSPRDISVARGRDCIRAGSFFMSSASGRLMPSSRATAGGNRLTHQLLAEIVYTTIYSMRDPKGKTLEGMFPCFCLREDDSDDPIMTKEDSDELQQLMVDLNAQQNPDK